MNKKINKVLSAITAVATMSATSLFSTTVAAGDEPVNCQTQLVGNQSVYSGTASCIASFYTIDGFYQTEYISQYVPETTVSSIYLNRLVFIGGRSYSASCVASIPFSHTQPVYDQVCEYTPKVNPRSYQDNMYQNSVYANASDRDGNVVKYEWWVDGVKQSNSGSSLTLTRRGSTPLDHVVKVTVTDNDGHTDTRTIVSTYKDPATCGNRRC